MGKLIAEREREREEGGGGTYIWVVCDHRIETRSESGGLGWVVWFARKLKLCVSVYLFRITDK